MKKTRKHRTINVAILAFETSATIPITGSTDVLNKSAAVWAGTYGKASPYATFVVEFVGITRKPLHFGDAITLRPHASIATAKKPDLVLIPSAGENVMETLDSLRAFVPWIKACSANGSRVVSLCTGAFLLAETGLLDDRAATTHWFLAEVFRRTYPKVNLHPERLIVDEGNVITSGAATSFLDLALYLIELYNGHEAAILVAKAFPIEMGRHSQLPYTIFSTQKMHSDRQILRVQQFMEGNSHRELTIESLAGGAAMSVRNFDRRFSNAVGQAPIAYLQKLRIEKAKRFLETTNDTVAEIMISVGYEDERSFRRLFHTLTDLSPKAYRGRYGNNTRQFTVPTCRSLDPLAAA
jgi:transcriptional regulator GlxA family with amidase domain